MSPRRASTSPVGRARRNPGVRIPPLFQGFRRRLRSSSIRIRLVAGLAIPILCLYTVAGLSLRYQAAASKDLHQTIDEVLETMMPANRLQLLLARAAMPPNDHLIDRDPRERYRWEALAGNIDSLLRDLRSQPPTRTAATILDSAEALWRQAFQLGNALLALPPDAPDRGPRMRRFDAAIDAAISEINTFYNVLVEDLRRREEAAWARQRHLVAGTLAAIALATLISVYVAVRVLRSVLVPLDALHRGAGRLASGDLEHRIGLEPGDEFGQLAARFDQMAEALQRERRRLADLADRDALTGLYNRRAFDRMLATEIRRAARQRAPAGLLLLDVDHFKAVNDRYGHPVGDEVLRHLARVASTALRPGDVIGRCGGEEFGVILPGADREATLHVAERLHRAVRTTPARLPPDLEIPVTVSIGAAVYPMDAPDPAALYQRADQALYAAKAAGRDRVQMWTAPTERQAERGEERSGEA